MSFMIASHMSKPYVSETYLVKLWRDGETGQVIGEAWYKNHLKAIDDLCPEVQFNRHCPHRPAQVIWDEETGNIECAVYHDENGYITKYIDIDPKTGFIKKVKEWQEDGSYKIYKPRTKKILFEYDEPSF